MFEKANEINVRPTIIRKDFAPTKPLAESIAVNTRPMTFHQALVDKTGPGERTHELHIGSTDLETKAVLLSQGGVEESIVRIAMDVGANTNLLKKMFPMKKDGGYLDTTNPHFTATSLQEEIKSSMKGYVDGSDLEIASMLYVAFMADLLKGTSIIQPSKPLVCTTQALDIFVSPDVIREQVRVNSLMMTLDEANLCLNLGRIKRLTPKYFITEACKVLSNLGITLMDDRRHEMYLDDAKHLVQMYHHPEKRFSLLPVDVRDDINLKTLASNISFTIFALTTPGSNELRTPAHLLSKALAYVVAVINKSPRMDVVTMDQIRKYIGHTQVKDPKGQVVGSIAWRNMNGAVRTQASRYVPMNRDESIHFQQPQKIVEEIFDSVGSKLFSAISGRQMADMTHEVMTNLATTESKPYSIAIGLTDYDMMHYAVASADAIYMRTEKENGDIFPSLVYEVHHNDNYLGSVGTYGEKSLLRNAAEAVTLCMDNEQNIEVAPRVQGIKDDARKGFLYGDPSLTSIPLASAFKYDMDVLGKKIRLNVAIEDLIGIYQSSQVMVHVPIVNRMLMNTYYGVVEFLKTTIAKASQAKDINTGVLEMMLALNVNKTLSTVYSSAAGRAVVKTIIFKILESLDVTNLEPYKLDLYRAERQIDMCVWSSLIMLVKMGCVDYEHIKLYRDMINAPNMIQALLASSDFDFSEI